MIKILINHYFTWFLSTCRQLQPCLVPGCLLVINYKSRYSRRHSHKRRNNYTSNGILFTLANNKNSNLRETEPLQSLAITTTQLQEEKNPLFTTSVSTSMISQFPVLFTRTCASSSRRKGSLAMNDDITQQSI